MSLRSFIPSVMIAAGLVIGITGCGQASSSPSSTKSTVSSTAQTSHSSKGHKKKHPRRHGRIGRGTVTAITTNQLQIKNKKGKIVTFTLSSKTHYRAKKARSAFSAVKRGISVVVRASKVHGKLAAHVVRIM